MYSSIIPSPNSKTRYPDITSSNELSRAVDWSFREMDSTTERFNEFLFFELASIFKPLHVHIRPYCSEGFKNVPNDRYVVDNRSEEHTSELQSQSNLVCRL